MARSSKKSTVVNTSAHAVDLDSGRTLAPGDTAQIEVAGNAHNSGLVADGHLTVKDGPVPTSAHEDEEK